MSKKCRDCGEDILHSKSAATFCLDCGYQRQLESQRRYVNTKRRSSAYRASLDEKKLSSLTESVAEYRKQIAECKKSIKAANSKINDISRKCRTCCSQINHLHPRAIFCISCSQERTKKSQKKYLQKMKEQA